MRTLVLSFARCNLLVLSFTSLLAAEEDYAQRFQRAWDAGDLHGAWYAAEQWADAAPEDYQMPVAKARVFLKLDAPVAALDEWRRLELNLPEGQAAEQLYRAKAQTLDELGELQGAWHAWWRSWQSRPFTREEMDPAAWAALESTLAKGLWPRMLNEARAVLDETPRHIGAKMIELEVLEDLGRTDEIRRLVEQAIEGGWDDPRLIDWQYYLRAQAQMASPSLDYQRRVELLERYSEHLRRETGSLESFPKFVHYIKGGPFGGYFDDEKVESPQTARQHAAALFPDDGPQSQFLKSNFLLLRGIADSKFWMERAASAKLQGRASEAIHALASALTLDANLSTDRKRQCILYIQQTLEDADRLALQAGAAWKAGDFQAAMSATTQALNIHPAHPRALSVKWSFAQSMGNLPMAHRSLRDFWRVYADEVEIPLHKAVNLAASAGDWPLVFSLTEQMLIAEGELPELVLQQRHRAAFALGFDCFIENVSQENSDPTLEKAQRAFDLVERSHWRRIPASYVEALEEKARQFDDFREAPFLALHGRSQMFAENAELAASAQRQMAFVAPEDERDFGLFSDFAQRRISQEAFLRQAEDSAFAHAILALVDNTEPSDTLKPSLSQRERFDSLWEAAGTPSLPLSMRLVAYRAASMQAKGPRLSAPRETTPRYMHPKEIPGSAIVSKGRRIVTTGGHEFDYEHLPTNQSVRIVGRVADLNNHMASVLMKAYLAGSASEPRLLQLENFALKFGDIRKGLTIEKGQFFALRNAEVHDFDARVRGGLVVETCEVSAPDIRVDRGWAVLRETVLGEAADRYSLSFIRGGQVHAVSVEVKDKQSGTVAVLSPDGDLDAIGLVLENKASLTFLDRNPNIETAGIEYRQNRSPQSSQTASRVNIAKLAPPREGATLELGEYRISPSGTTKLNADIAKAKSGTKILLNDNAYSAYSPIELPAGILLQGTGDARDRTKLTGRVSAKHIIAIRGPSDQVTKVDSFDLGFAGEPTGDAAILVDGAKAIIESVYPSNNNWRLWRSGKFPFLKVINGGTVVLRSTQIWGPIIADESSSVVLDRVRGGPMTLRGGGAFIVEEKRRLSGKVTVAGEGTRFEGPPGMVRYADGAGDKETLLSLKEQRNASWAKAKQTYQEAVASAQDADTRAKAARALANAVLEANNQAMQTPPEALDYLADALKPLLREHAEEAHLIAYRTSRELSSGDLIGGLYERLQDVGLQAYHRMISYQTAHYFVPKDRRVDNTYIEDTYELLLEFPNRGAGFRWARQMRKEGASVAEARRKGMAEDSSARYWSPEQVAKREREAQERKQENGTNSGPVITTGQRKQFYEVAVERGHTDFQRTLAFQLGGNYLVDWAHRHRKNTSDPYAPTIEELQEIKQLADGQIQRDIDVAIQARKAGRERIQRAQASGNRSSWEDFKSDAADARRASAIKQRQRDLQRGIFRSRESYGLDD